MAHLLIIDLPGGNDTDIIEAAVNAGHTFSFLTSQLDLYRSQASVQTAISSAVEQLDVPGFEYAQVERSVLDLHQRYPIDAVLCLIDIRLIEASLLAKRLNLVHLNPDSAKLLRDKFSVRRRLSERGLIQPEFALAQTNEELKMAVARLGLPVLIKPADGYGSQNVVVLRNAEDLDPLLSPLEDMLPSRADYGLGVLANDRLLVERYMEGSFIGCDTFSVNGQHRMLGVNEKLMFDPPSFAIKGGCFTPNCPQFAAIERYAFDALDAVGFDWGAAHIELMITADGPRVIEINPRLVGAKIARLVGYALGRSVHEDLIRVHLGHWPGEILKEQHPMVAVTRWIIASEFGVIEKIEPPSWTDPQIRCVEILKASGHSVRPPFENSDRIGYVMTCGTERSDVERLAERFVAETTVLIKEPQESVCGRGKKSP